MTSVLNIIFRQQENLADNQQCQAGFRALCNKILLMLYKDMFKNKLVDNIIKEPEGGAHYNPEEIYDRVRETIIKDIKSLSKLDPQKRNEKRIEKFCSMGVINE